MVPSDPIGEITLISVVLCTVKLEADEEPKVTANTLLKSVPVIVTEVPPVVGPEDG